MTIFGNLSNALLGIVLSIAAGMATGLGALPMLFIRKKISDAFIDLSLAFAAGVMLAAASFSLIRPAIEQGGVFQLIVGILAGILFVDIADKKIPHDHFIKDKKVKNGRSKKIFLFVLTILIHNFPEGLAVGIGGFSKDAISLAVAIGIQNVLEGLAVAAALISADYDIKHSVLIAFLTGLVEPLGAILGVSLVGFSTSILPYALAFAGGSMLFVISHEVIPETHSRDYRGLATYSLISGFTLMTILDYILG
jgi:ZIP family zinc transporter